jgi:hypothetical protein
MSNKDELMVVVRAFNTFITANTVTTAQLKDAQDQLAALKLSDSLTDAEQAEVNTALTNAAAVTPPTPAAVAAVAVTA